MSRLSRVRDTGASELLAESVSDRRIVETPAAIFLVISGQSSTEALRDTARAMERCYFAAQTEIQTIDRQFDFDEVWKVALGRGYFIATDGHLMSNRS